MKRQVCRDVRLLRSGRANIGSALRDPVIAIRVNFEFLSAELRAVNRDSEFAFVLNQDAVGSIGRCADRVSCRAGGSAEDEGGHNTACDGGDGKPKATFAPAAR